MTERDHEESVGTVRRLRPTHAEPAHDPMAAIGVPASPLLGWVGAWLMQMRQRWLLASIVAILVAAPIAAYAVFAVPSYTSNGVLQVSNQQGGLDPMLDLLGGGGSGEIETEVEIIQRREFVLAVLKDLRLQVVESGQPTLVTMDPSVSLGGRSPTSEGLRRVRAAITTAEVASHYFAPLQLELVGVDASTLGVDVVHDQQREHFELAVGAALEHQSFTLALAEQPLELGEEIVVQLLPDGELLERTMNGLAIAAMGDERKPTNLVSIAFTHEDRDIARAVVDGIMQSYLAQSLDWQSQGAAKAATFIEQRLEQAQEDLQRDEEELRAFSEKERAVQLDTQARVTIENGAALETERRHTELQESVLGSVITGMKNRARVGDGAHLTASFFEDPVLSVSIGALTEAETKHAMMSATLTAEHPEVRELGRQLDLQRKEVGKLLRTAKQSISARRQEIDKQLAAATAVLSSYPEKEVQMARLLRDVDVSQRLYGFLLERHREAEIVEASTTIDKRVVDTASLPHRTTAPKRGRLVATGVASTLLAVFAAVWLAHTLQRRLHTVEAIKRELPVAVYGSLPQVGATKAGRARLDFDMIWGDAHSPSAEAFRALCVSVALSPSRGRGRVIQVTSSQPGEGKSTVVSNLAVSLRKTGATVLVVDLDLRKPVQHRQWSCARAPGYAELVAEGGGVEQFQRVVQHSERWGVDLISAGSKLPDSMSSLMSPLLATQLDEWCTRYDFVLLDSPPAFVPDTTIVAGHADLLLVVARPGVVERSSLRFAIAALSRVDVAKGLVLNGVTRNHSEDYYGSSYAYQYGSAYGERDDDQRVAS
jgi:capsular exopolysaccharide synthesis family protein